MRKISDALKKHILESVTTIANCWFFKLGNGIEFGFTDYGTNIIYQGVTYSNEYAISFSSVESTSSLVDDNFEIEIALHDVFIKEKVFNANFNNAYVEYFIINYADLFQGRVLIKSGYISEIRDVDRRLFIEIRGISQYLHRQTRHIYSETCRARFRDKKCAVNDTNHILYGSVIAVIDDYTIETDLSISYPHIYRHARAQLINGDVKIDCLVKDISKHLIFFNQTDKIELKQGMKILLFPECDKSFKTCCDIFNNSLNFRGEPFVPGIDEINKTAGSFK